MRVALVYRSLHLTGSLARFHVELGRYLVRRGHDVHVFSIASQSDPSLVPGATFHPVPIVPRRGTGTFSVNELLSFAISSQRRVKRAQFDIVHVRAPSAWRGDVLHVPAVVRGGAAIRGTSSARLAANLLRRPGNLARYAVERRSFWSGAFERFHAEVPLVGEHIHRYYGVDPERILVVPPGVNLDQFRPTGDRAGARAAIGLEHDRPAVLFCGHDFERKGLDVAIEAVAAARSRPDLLVLGDTAGADRYRELAARRRVSDRIRFLDVRDDAERIYAAADIFVLPTSFDIWGATVVESMASGVPPIVSSAAGAATVVEDGVTGIVLRSPVDVRDLRIAIDGLLDDPDRRVEMGAAAARRASLLGWDAHGSLVETDLLQLMEARVGRRRRR